MISLCIPTLNRYDLLERLIESSELGTIKPNKYLIIDNGNKLDKREFDRFNADIEIISFGYNIGVAKSWNKFISLTDPIRIICNDDVIFDKDTINSFIVNYDKNSFMTPDSIAEQNMFSCFSIPDFVIDTVGFFDQNISPNYAYYEDNDVIMIKPLY